MQKADVIKAVAALCLLALAVGLAVRFFISNKVSEKAFFYDLSEKKLFTAARDQVPPIKGINDAEEDAVRAVVISTTGKPEDKESWSIAYLEKYSPELREQMIEAQKTGTSPRMGRVMAQAHRFVRRVNEDRWHALNTEQGERIVTDWATPGPHGITPIICTPQ